MEGDLWNIQTALQDDWDNSQLLDIEKNKRSNLVHLKSMEKMFFSQKLKHDYFIDYDRGTSFFHAIHGSEAEKEVHCFY